jgi:ABC-2 type transport system ATP-binding protein
LCRRVIIIDHGRVIHDGSWEQIVRDFSDRKEIVLRFSGPPPDLQGPDWGEVVEKDAATLRLRVSLAQATSVSRRAIDLPGLEDIRIEAMPVEEVIRRVFAASPSR